MVTRNVRLTRSLPEGISGVNVRGLDRRPARQLPRCAATGSSFIVSISRLVAVLVAMAVAVAVAVVLL